jgi:hypothetical protein
MNISFDYRKIKGVKTFDPIIGGKHQKMNSTFTPIERAISRTLMILSIAVANQDYEVED